MNVLNVFQFQVPCYLSAQKSRALLTTAPTHAEVRDAVTKETGAAAALDRIIGGGGATAALAGFAHI